MKKLLIIALCIMSVSCKSAFGTPQSQSDEQRKRDKVFSRTLLGVLATAAVIVVIDRN